MCGWDGTRSSYNSEPLNDPCRHARLKRVHWAADGTPILKMTYENELMEGNDTVFIQVNIVDPFSPPAGTEPDSTVSNKPSPVPGTGTSASVSGSKKTAHVTLGKKKCKEKDVEKRKDVPCKS